jgi:hypothetical protein
VSGRLKVRTYLGLVLYFPSVASSSSVPVHNHSPNSIRCYTTSCICRLNRNGDFYVLEYNAGLSGDSQWTFRQTAWSPSSRTESPAYCLLYTPLLFDPEDVDIFFRNVDWLVSKYTALYPRERTWKPSGYCRSWAIPCVRTGAWLIPIQSRCFWDRIGAEVSEQPLIARAQPPIYLRGLAIQFHKQGSRVPQDKGKVTRATYSRTHYNELHYIFTRHTASPFLSAPEC